MNPPKIILLTHEYPPFRGGAGIYCEEIAYASIQLGLNLEVWAPKGSLKSPDKRVSLLPFKGSQSVVSSMFLICESAKRFRNLPQDTIIHLAEPGSLRAFLRFSWVLRRMPPYFITIHGSEIVKFSKNPLESFLFRRFLLGAKRIHVMSKFNKHALLQICPEIETRLFTISGAPARRILPTGDCKQKKGNRLIILCVGRIHPRKGQDKLLQAVMKFPSALIRKIELRLIGPIICKKFFKKLKRQAKDLDCKVEFLGDLNDHELSAHFQNSNLFALVSMPRNESIEGFGFAYLEASAHGLAILAHRFGGVEDTVKHEETGILVDPYSEDALPESLELLLKDKELRERLGRNGKKWANAHTWKKTASLTYLRN